MVEPELKPPAAREAMITDAVAVLAPVVSHLEAAGVTVRTADDGAKEDDVLRAAKGIPVLITGFLPFGSKELNELEGTELIVRAGIGYDSIDVAAATEAGIWVANVPDFCVDEVADHTMLLLLAAARRLPEAMNFWREQSHWAVNAQLPEMHRTKGRTLGLIGFGRIGRAVAIRAQAFGWKILVYDPYLPPDVVAACGATSVGLDDLALRSDAISLHCPLNDDTQHLVDATFLEHVKGGATIVNTGRGGLVDLDALDAAVGAGDVAYAALDVLDGEPDPDLAHPLLQRPNVLVTSHSGWRSVDAVAELAAKSAEQAVQFFDGQIPTNVLNPQARQ